VYDRTRSCTTSFRDILSNLRGPPSRPARPGPAHPASSRRSCTRRTPSRARAQATQQRREMGCEDPAASPARENSAASDSFIDIGRATFIDCEADNDTDDSQHSEQDTRRAPSPADDSLLCVPGIYAAAKPRLACKVAPLSHIVPPSPGPGPDEPAAPNQKSLSRAGSRASRKLRLSVKVAPLESDEVASASSWSVPGFEPQKPPGRILHLGKASANRSPRPPNLAASLSPSSLAELISQRSTKSQSRQWRSAVEHDRSSRDAIMAQMDLAQVYTDDEERNIASGLELLDGFGDSDAGKEMAPRQSHVTLTRERITKSSASQRLVGSCEAIIRGATPEVKPRPTPFLVSALIRSVPLCATGHYGISHGL
jgi:hypothetical protein